MRKILSVLLLTSFGLAAQPKVFTAQDLVNAIKKYHPVARQADLGVQIAKAEITAARGAFDPLLSVNNNEKEYSAIPYYNQQITELKVPTWYGVDVYAGKEVLSGDRLNPQETKGGVNYLGVAVPIHGLLMDKRRAALRQARFLKDLSEAQRLAIVNDLLYDGLKAYWSWWQQYQLSGLTAQALKNAQTRYTMVKTAVLLGDRAGIDTIEALTQVQSFLIRQSEVFLALRKAQLELSTYLWADRQNAYELPVDATPGDSPARTSPMLDELLGATGTHPELVQYQFKVKVLEVEKRAKLMQLLPQFTIKYQQLGYTFSKVVKDSWFQNNYRYGFSLSVPLRLSQGRGEYQKAKLKLQQTQLEQANKQVQLYNKVKQYHTEWAQTNTQLSIQQSLTANIQNLQKGEEIKFLNGESSLFLVNARELKTLETQQKLLELRAKNAIAYVSMQWAAGLLPN